MQVDTTTKKEHTIVNRRTFLKTLFGFGAILAAPSLVLATENTSTKPKDNDGRVGYTGQRDYDAGYFYAPFIPLMRAE